MIHQMACSQCARDQRPTLAPRMNMEWGIRHHGLGRQACHKHHIGEDGGLPFSRAAGSAPYPAKEQITMVHRHPGLGISQAEIPYSFLPSCPIALSLHLCKIPFHSIAKILPGKMLLSAFSLLQRSDRSLSRACSMECTYVST